MCIPSLKSFWVISHQWCLHNTLSKLSTHSVLQQTTKKSQELFHWWCKYIICTSPFSSCSSDPVNTVQCASFNIPTLCFSLSRACEPRRRPVPSATPPLNWEPLPSVMFARKAGCTTNRSSQRRERYNTLHLYTYCPQCLQSFPIWHCTFAVYSDDSRFTTWNVLLEDVLANTILRLLIKGCFPLSASAHCRKLVAACGHGNVSSLCFVPIRSSSTRTSERPSFMGRGQGPARTRIPQSASAAAWSTLPTAKPSVSTPWGWPRRTSASTCCRPRTGMTCWPGSGSSGRTARLTTRLDQT